MILRILSNLNADDFRERTVTNPTFEDVVEAHELVDWTNHSSIELLSNEHNYLFSDGGIELGGFTQSLVIDAIEFVAYNEPSHPREMLNAFAPFLDGDFDNALKIILDADRRGLSSENIAEIRSEHRNQVAAYVYDKVIPRAKKLLRKNKYSSYIQRVSPYSPLLQEAEREELLHAKSKIEELN